MKGKIIKPVTNPQILILIYGVIKKNNNSLVPYGAAAQHGL
jgi:hypothetical protein